MIGIYKIISPTNRIYIGSSTNIERRKDKYRRLGCKSQRRLYNSFIKYGWGNHSFEIIEECDINILLERELFYGLLFNVLDKNTGLNCKLPKIDDFKKTISDKTLEKMSLVQKGKKLSIESKLKMSNSQKGRKHSKSTKEKQKLSNSNLKLVLNLETGIYYYGTNETSIAMNINSYTLKNKLNGSKKNNTSLIYA